jgi:hypothetical protein
MLIQHIENIEAGRSSIENCLDRYPSMREQLEPLLMIAPAIREPRGVKPPFHLQDGARLRLMEQIHGKGECNKMTLLSL